MPKRQRVSPAQRVTSPWTALTASLAKKTSWRRPAHLLFRGQDLHGHLRHQRRTSSPGLLGRNPSPDDLHWHAAAGAKKCRPGFLAGRRARCDLEDEVQQGNQAFAIGVQKTVVPCPAEALGQDVLQDQTQEICTRQGAYLHFTTLTVAVAKADCLCTHMRNFEIWTCGQLTWRLKDTTRRNEDGSYQVLSTARASSPLSADKAGCQTNSMPASRNSSNKGRGS